MIAFGLSRHLFRSGMYGRATTVVYTSISTLSPYLPRGLMRQQLRRALGDKNTPSMPHVVSHMADK